MSLSRKWNVWLFICSLVCAVMFISPLEAQQKKTSQPLVVTENSLEKLVLENNFDYKKAKVQYSTTARTMQGVWNDFFPSISGFIQRDFIKNKIFTDNPAANTMDGFTAMGLSAEMNLTAWVVFNIMKTTSDFNVGKITFEAAQNKILDTVKKTFYNLIMEQKLLELQKSTVDLAETNYAQAAKRYKNGLIQRVAMLSTQVELENQRNTYEQSRITHEKNLLTFKVVVGIPLDRDIVLQGDITIVPKRLDSIYLIENYLEKNPNVRLAQAQIWANRWNSYYNHLSIISPFASLKYNILDPNIHNKQPGAPDKWADAFSLNFGIKIQFDSLLPWSKSGLKLYALRDVFALSKEAAKNERLQAHVAIVNAVNIVNSTQSNIQTLQHAYELSSENLALTVTGYQQGTREFLEIQQAVKNRSDALSNYLKAQLGYYSSLLDLAYLTNTSITEILNNAIASNE